MQDPYFSWRGPWCALAPLSTALVVACGHGAPLEAAAMIDDLRDEPASTWACPRRLADAATCAPEDDGFRWDTGPAAVTRFTWEAWLHPGSVCHGRGAWREAGFRLQCTYNSDGQLITDGIAAGTIDYGADLFTHGPRDVQPFVDAVIDAGGDPRAAPISDYLRRYPTPGVLLDVAAAGDTQASGRLDYARIRVERFVPDNRTGVSLALHGGVASSAAGNLVGGAGSVLALRGVPGLPQLELAVHADLRDERFTLGGVTLRLYPFAAAAPTGLPMRPDVFVGGGVSHLATTGEDASPAALRLEVGFHLPLQPWLAFSARLVLDHGRDGVVIAPDVGFRLSVPFIGAAR